MATGQDKCMHSLIINNKIVLKGGSKFVKLGGGGGLKFDSAYLFCAGCVCFFCGFLN